MDGATFVSLTGSLHREDEPAHMTILDPAKCLACEADYANSCTHFCPGQVYRWDGAKIVLSRLELPPLHDLRREVPAREHPLAAARGRRGSALQADVGAAGAGARSGTLARRWSVGGGAPRAQPRVP